MLANGERLLPEKLLRAVGYQIIDDRRVGQRTGIAHFAHLGGMLFGFLLIFYWRGKLPLKPKHRMFW